MCLKVWYMASQQSLFSISTLLYAVTMHLHFLSQCNKALAVITVIGTESIHYLSFPSVSSTVLPSMKAQFGN